MKRWLTILVLLVAPASARAVDVEEFPALGEFIQEMHTRHGFAERDLQAWFADAEIEEGIIAAITRPREALPWHRYKPSFVNAKLARMGAAYWRQHASTLARAERTYGVAPEIVLAIVGVETHFGRNLGRFRIIDALTTLTVHYPPRAPFFRRELAEFLLLARDLKRDPLSFKGSYAGAMGIGQFMPSSYRAYAVDFDDDGARDLLSNPTDALGSVANYLKQHGWRKDEPIYATLSPAQTAAAADAPSAAPDTQGGDDATEVVELANEDGPLFRLTYPNFATIMRYNRSRHYAMAVAELSELIRAEYAPKAAPAAENLEPPDA